MHTQPEEEIADSSELLLSDDAIRAIVESASRQLPPGKVGAVDANGTIFATAATTDELDQKVNELKEPNFPYLRAYGQAP